MTILQQKLDQLNLLTMSQQLEPTLTEATARNLSVAQTLEALVDRELEARSQRTVERRFKLSDRKSTRLNSSHLVISYAVFCLKKKTTQTIMHHVPSHHETHHKH